MRVKTKLAIASALVVALVAGQAAMGQAAASAPAETEAVKDDFDPAAAKAVVERLAVDLEENFVFPDTGAAYARMLRDKAGGGAYADFPSATRFAEIVTADLQAVSPDRHLRLFPPKAFAEARPGGASAPSSSILESGWKGDGIAYIKFAAFFGDAATVKALNHFLDEHRDASSLIIDAREHRGGGLTEIDILFSRLFDTETELVRMDTRLAAEARDTDALGDPPTLRRIEGPATIVRRAHFARPGAEATPLRDARVFLLTSKRTASAAEHLALSLKRTHRATLIGETTRGAGNYGMTMDLGHGYGAFVPFGRTFDPDTGEGWEGVGVKPDVDVPADQALDEALRRAAVPE